MFDFPGGQAAAFCVSFAIGAAGYFLFKFLRFPNPAVLGSMTVTGALNAAGFFPFFDTRAVSFVASVVVGVTLGQLIDRTVIGRIIRMARHVLVQTAGMLALSLVCGLSLHVVSGIDLTTSLVSGATGGITEMIIFGIFLDAEVSTIAFIHLFRLVFFITLIPYLGLIAEKITGVPLTPHSHNTRVKDVTVEFFGRKDFLTLIFMAFAGGGLAFWLNVPAGAMLGAMFAGGGLALLLGKQYKFDSRLRLAALIVIGLVTGMRITPQFVEQLGTLLIPAMVVTVIMLIGCTLLAVVLYKTSGWSLTTCLLSVAPAGMNQIVPLAEDLGADPLTASVFHIARIVGIVTFYPWLVLPLIS